MADFYKNKSRLNLSYGDDLGEQNKVKRFILSKIKRNEGGCQIEGLRWIEEFLKDE